MTEMPRFTLKDVLLLLLVLAAAAAVRVGYLLASMDDLNGPAPLLVQGPASPPGATPSLPADSWDEARAPLSDAVERTAHVSPGYPWLVGRVVVPVIGAERAPAVLRWTQCGLGALTAALYFFFARRAFRSAAVGTLAGLFCALHPFWVVNTLELDDGVLASFLLGCALFFGARASQEGDALGSLLYGLSLAALALVRAALLPFATVALLWFLLRSRDVARGWLCALLAFLGFANGLAPWTVRNLRAFHEPVPIVDSMYLHLWMGNNAAATGGPQDEEALRASLPRERLQELLAEKNQVKRYALLARDVLDQAAAEPPRTLHRRLLAGQCFVFGEAWVKDGTLAVPQEANRLPAGLADWYPMILEGTLLGMLLLGLLGWRWTYGWRRLSMPASLAVMWIPLPYLLGHGGTLSGPRLPLDGVLLCYSAFALLCLMPGIGPRLLRGAGQEMERG